MIKKYITSLTILLLIIAILLVSNGCNTESPEELEKVIGEKLEAIVANPHVAHSSNPYDYIKDNEDYRYIISQGERSLQYMLKEFQRTRENGLKEYIMALACCEILGGKQEGIIWSSGREWYEQYVKGSSKQEVNIDIKGDIIQMYTAVLDSFIPLDKGLNYGMKYIAIDTGTLKHLPEDNKEELLSYFEKYNVQVVDASLEELKEKGMFNEETLSLEGILLSIEDVEVLSEMKVVVHGSKYRSGLGAIGVECTVVYEDGRWQVEKAHITWIS